MRAVSLRHAGGGGTRSQSQTFWNGLERERAARRRAPSNRQPMGLRSGMGPLGGLDTGPHFKKSTAKAWAAAQLNLAMGFAGNRLVHSVPRGSRHRGTQIIHPAKPISRLSNFLLPRPLRTVSWASGAISISTTASSLMISRSLPRVADPLQQEPLSGRLVYSSDCP
jgi:hypothetical protein